MYIAQATIRGGLDIDIEFDMRDFQTVDEYRIVAIAGERKNCAWLEKLLTHSEKEIILDACFEEMNARRHNFSEY